MFWEICAQRPFVDVTAGRVFPLHFSFASARRWFEPRVSFSFALQHHKHICLAFASCIFSEGFLPLRFATRVLFLFNTNSSFLLRLLGLAWECQGECSRRSFPISRGGWRRRNRRAIGAEAALSRSSFVIDRGSPNGKVRENRRHRRSRPCRPLGLRP